MLLVYRTIRSLCGSCIYKRVDVMAVRVWCILSCCVTVVGRIINSKNARYWCKKNKKYVNNF